MEYVAKNKNFATGKTSWNTVRPFTTNKGTISEENIKVIAEENQNIKIKNKNKSKLVFVEMFSIVEKHLALHQKVLEIPLYQKMMKKL